MPETRKLRFGILGTGNIAGQFSAGVQAARRCTLAAVGSRSINSAEAFADRFAIPTRHGRYEDLFADPTIDAVYVSAPNALHRPLTLAALAAGKHVLCEKPLALTAAEAEEMFDAARRAGRLLVEAFMYLSHPQTLAVTSAVQRDRAVGNLSLIRSNFCYATRKIEGNVRFSRALGGGALMDVGCYCISLARHLFRAEPDAVHASARFHDPSGVDVLTSVLLQFPGGRQSLFSCGMQTHGDNTAHLCGDAGWIEVPWPWKPAPDRSGYTVARGIPPRQDQAGSASTLGVSQSPPAPGGAAVASGRQHVPVPVDGDLFGIEADDFASSVLDGAPPRVSREFSIGNLRVLDWVREKIGLTWPDRPV